MSEAPKTPRRAKSGLQPHGLNWQEREEYVNQRERDYYESHRSARIARWTAIAGGVVMVVGFFVSMSLSRTVADIGNATMAVGLVAALIAIFFFSAVTQS